MEEIFYGEGSEMVEQFAQKDGDAPPSGPGIQSQGSFKVRLEGALSNLIWMKKSLTISGELDMMTFKALTNSNHSMILWSGAVGQSPKIGWCFKNPTQ